MFLLFPVANSVSRRHWQHKLAALHTYRMEKERLRGESKKDRYPKSIQVFITVAMIQNKHFTKAKIISPQAVFMVQIKYLYSESSSLVLENSCRGIGLSRNMHFHEVLQIPIMSYVHLYGK